ncbi:nucleotidyltransferase domain-containing protein [Eubacteriales bacterium OttesenSCG-928-N13]|nr:nucleotidyltransferase domain-containing protein [Eubacteriales bacterium OttesenSCG-928-N13]
MYPHHIESIEKMKQYFEKDPEVLGLILGGSVAQGRERPDSDLDGMVIVSPETYQRICRENRQAECIFGESTYEAGYFDVKYMTMDYLRAAAERGSDPTRNSFRKSRVLFSRIDGLEDVVARISLYPVEKKQERIDLFYSILNMEGHYFFDCATKEGDKYLLDKAVVNIIYGGFRALLAMNEQFFPCHRNMLSYVENLEDKPENIMALMDALLKDKSYANRDAFMDAIIAHLGDWIEPENRTKYQAIYVTKLEQTWQFSDDNVFEL